MKSDSDQNSDLLFAADDNEVLDLVDSRDNVICRQKRLIVYSEGKSNYRVINAFIENSLGQLYILRRSIRKRYFPLALDFSVGGHVLSGESYDEAFKREIKEELKIDLNSIKYQLIGYLNPAKDGVSSFMKVYKIFTEATPDFNRNEFTEGYWLSPTELASRINSGEPAKDDLIKLLFLYFEIK